MSRPNPLNLTLRLKRSGLGTENEAPFDPGDALLLESGDFFLLEDGTSHLLLEPDGT